MTHENIKYKKNIDIFLFRITHKHLTKKIFFYTQFMMVTVFIYISNKFNYKM